MGGLPNQVSDNDVILVAILDLRIYLWVLNACIGKELIRNPETLQMLLEDTAADDNEEEEMEAVEDSQDVLNDNDEDPVADIEGAVVHNICWHRNPHSFQDLSVLTSFGLAIVQQSFGN